ncbi:MAG TPA: hypothetical protein VD811_11885 [Desulfuromonadales bacterium]|nr:hypothetical protein [Desulfuromonadales bacterium]
MLPRRPVRGVDGQSDRAVLHARQQEGSIASLGEVSVGDEDGVVVAERPKAVVEQPVGVFGEGEAVIQVVVAAAGELVDVGGIDDGAGGKSNEAIAGQGTG